MDEWIIEELKMNIEEGIGYLKKISSESNNGGGWSFT